jgi:hypothetical protein
MRLSGYRRVSQHWLDSQRRRRVMGFVMKLSRALRKDGDLEAQAEPVVKGFVVDGIRFARITCVAKLA